MPDHSGLGPEMDQQTEDDGTMRQFDTGATRDTAADKLDFEAFLSPAVLLRYAQYMHKCREQSDGKLRDGDNWQKGIPIPVYMKSKMRHIFDTWLHHRNLGHLAQTSDLEDCLCAEIFNSMGMLHEILKAKREAAPTASGRRIYLSHPIRGMQGMDASPEYIAKNNRVAIEAGNILRQSGHIVHVPAKHEEFVSRAMNGCMTTSQVLEVDCEIIDTCDVVVFFAHEGIGPLSNGMTVERKHALYSRKKVYTGRTLDDIRAIAEELKGKTT